MEETLEMGADGRKNNFGIIRLTAALMVMAGHMGILSGTEVPSFIGQAIQGIGVKVFFLLGGYLITKSWLGDPHPLRYGIKRFFRLIPPLAVYVIIAALVVGPLLSSLSPGEYYSSPVSWAYFSNIALHVNYFLPGVFGTVPYPNAVNGSLWSIPVEAAMYIIMPVAVFLTGLRKNTKRSHVLLGILTIAVCSFQIFTDWFFPGSRMVFYGTDWVQGLRLMPYYFIGSLFVLPEIRKLVNLQVASIVLLVYSCLSLDFPISEIAVLVVLPYFVFSLALDKQAYFVDRLKKWEISYGLFLYGFFVQQMMMYFLQILNISLLFIEYYILCVALTIVPAYISRKYIELPCIALSKRILRSNALTAAIKKK